MQILGIPSALGCLCKSKGVSKAPTVIANNLHFIFSQQNLPPPIYSEVKINQANLEESFHNIEIAAKGSAKETIFLGGDHSITYPLVKGLVNDSFALVVFDAHPDCVHDFSPPTQEDFVRALVADKILAPRQIFLVGLRAFFQPEMKFLAEKKIRCYPMDTVFDLGMQQVMDLLTEQLLPFKAIYVSLDMDCIDPAFAPGVDYPEPGGLSSREIMYAINRLAKLRSFSYVDVVETNPEKDNGQTAWLAAKLLAGIRRL